MAETNTIFEIKLTPVTSYFFGGENGSELGNKTDYFQRSLEYPQQTTLLGMLRHKILRDNGINLEARLYNNPDDRASELIGKQGFDGNVSAAEPFGKICCISPVFITAGDGAYLWDKSFESIKNTDKKDSGNIRAEELIIGEKAGSHRLYWRDSFVDKTESYLSKHFPAELLSNMEKGKLMFSQALPGIDKGGKAPATREDSFFMMEYRDLFEKISEVKTSSEQKFYKTRKASFAFLAAVKSDCGLREGTDFITMGKERSLFKTEIREIKKLDFETEKEIDLGTFLKLSGKADSPVLKCVLLSDARLKEAEMESLNKCCLLQHVKKKRLRYLHRKTGKLHSGARPDKSTSAYNLLAKGSVLFLEADNKEKITALFETAPVFKQIGYNYIIFTNAKTIDL